MVLEPLNKRRVVARVRRLEIVHATVVRGPSFEREPDLGPALLDADVHVPARGFMLGRKGLFETLKSGIHLLEARVNLREAGIDLLEAGIHLLEAGVNLLEAGKHFLLQIRDQHARHDPSIVGRSATAWQNRRSQPAAHFAESATVNQLAIGNSTCNRQFNLQSAIQPAIGNLQSKSAIGNRQSTM
jgi:hypothetical protein